MNRRPHNWICLGHAAGMSLVAVVLALLSPSAGFGAVLMEVDGRAPEPATLDLAARVATLSASPRTESSDADALPQLATEGLVSVISVSTTELLFVPAESLTKKWGQVDEHHRASLLEQLPQVVDDWIQLFLEAGAQTYRQLPAGSGMSDGNSFPRSIDLPVALGTAVPVPPLPLVGKLEREPDDHVPPEIASRLFRPPKCA